jgi:phosphatidate cytidylyltransferase
MLIQLLLPVTPFTWYGAGLMALLISVMGSSGNMTIAAIKRDRGVKSHGTLVQGHVGALDRVDSICFAAPIFFHVSRFFLTPQPAMQDSDGTPVSALINCLWSLLWMT